MDRPRRIAVSHLLAALSSILVASCGSMPAPADGANRDAAADVASRDASDAAQDDGTPSDVGPADVPRADVPLDATDAPSPDAIDASDTTMADVPTSPSTSELHARADRALESLLLHYWNPGARYLNAESPSNGTLTGYWTFAQAFDAVLDGVFRTGGAHYVGWIEALYDSQNARGWSRNYFDDENWMALALIRAYDFTNDSQYLTEAESLYHDIMTAAPDTSCCGSTPGGLWWDRAHTQKATAINAGAVITGARLHHRTGNASYLTFAQHTYSFWLQHMVNPTTHQVADHINSDGTVQWWRFTYNEALMIGAGIELANEAGDATALSHSHDIAHFMIAHEVVAASTGNVLFDGDATHCGGDCAQFKGIGYRYLLALYEQDPTHTEYYDVLRASADAIWNDARSTADLFAIDWRGPPPGSLIINADSSATMALELDAMRAGAYPTAPDPTLLEAEDGVVHSIGLEASHAGFSGWAYLAGWSADGQWVDLHPSVASAGTYNVTFHYAAGAGSASRYLFANGHTVVANLSFPSTVSWNTWSTVTARVPLNAGVNTLSVIFNSSMGSSSYVNLDSVTIAP